MRLVRGPGFAETIAGGSLTAALIPRSGQGLALMGLVGCVPSLVALPLGPWPVRHVGYGPATTAPGVLPLRRPRPWA